MAFDRPSWPWPESVRLAEIFVAMQILWDRVLLGMMVFMSPKLAMVGLSIVPPMAIWAVFMGRKVRAQGRVVQDQLANATQLAEERLSNIRTVNAFGKQDQETLDYRHKMSKVLEVSAKEASIHSKFYGMVGNESSQAN